jgi:peptide/nickel transport system permease protein
MGVDTGAAHPLLPKPERPEPAAPATPGFRSRAYQGLVRFLRVIAYDPLTLAGFIIVVAAVVTALVIVLVPVITQFFLGHAISVLPYPIGYIDSNAVGQPPNSAHWFGTDEIGRDVFTLTFAALPLDLALGVGVAGIALVIGGGLGLVAGYYDNPGTRGGAMATTILRVTDVFLALPTFVLALAIAVTLGETLYTIFLALVISWWPYYVRLVRAEVLTIRPQLYVAAARAAGVPDRRIIMRHVLRNLTEPLVEYFTLDVGSVIITFSTLAFILPNVINISVTPEWGAMIQNYQPFFLTYPWTVLAPGLAIFITVLGFSLLGDGIQNALDPRSTTIVGR